MFSVSGTAEAETETTGCHACSCSYETPCGTRAAPRPPVARNILPPLLFTNPKNTGRKDKKRLKNA
jgi:hypothetical protein